MKSYVYYIIETNELAESETYYGNIAVSDGLRIAIFIGEI